MKLKIVVKKGESGLFVANVPALKGCWSQGRTVKEAIKNAKEAATLWLEVEQDKKTRFVKGKIEIFDIQL